MDTALHWFTRVADRLFGQDQRFIAAFSLHEDLVPDCFTVLEALLLKARDRGKGPKISNRAAALIAEDDAKVEDLAKAVKAAYDLRNDLVHGDVHPPANELREASQRLCVWVKQVLVAMLRLGGDLDQAIRGVDDAGVRESNRALVPRYPCC